jgi:di/tricarboxylate transporter
MSCIIAVLVSRMTIFNVCDLPTLFHAPCNATARMSARQQAPSIYAQHPCCSLFRPCSTACMSSAAATPTASILFTISARYIHSVSAIRFAISGAASQLISVLFCLFFLPNSIVCTNQTQTFQFPWQFKCNMHCSD